MHDAIRSLNEELQQERHSWETPASGVPPATLPADLIATPDLKSDTQKPKPVSLTATPDLTTNTQKLELVSAVQQQDDQQQHDDQSEAGSDDSEASR